MTFGYINVNISVTKSEVMSIAGKKMGRPTDDPKVNQVRIRMSDEDVKKLEYCSSCLGKTKAEIVRLGVDTVYRQLKK